MEKSTYQYLKNTKKSQKKINKKLQKKKLTN